MQESAFTITTRIYRGSDLTKDAVSVYLRGLINLLNYLKTGGKLDPLFVRKIAADHFFIIRELQWCRVLKPAPLRPRFMDLSGAVEKLELLRNGVSVLGLVEGGG